MRPNPGLPRSRSVDGHAGRQTGDAIKSSSSTLCVLLALEMIHKLCEAQHWPLHGWEVGGRWGIGNRVLLILLWPLGLRRRPHALHLRSPLGMLPSAGIVVMPLRMSILLMRGPCAASGAKHRCLGRLSICTWGSHRNGRHAGARRVH